MSLEVDVIPQQEIMGLKATFGKSVLVIDTLRASSTMVTAMACGVTSIIPVFDVETARVMKRRHKDYLLAGERDGQKIPGFDLGNSPLEFTEQAVKGKTLIMTTSNGTRALLAAGGAISVMVGSFLNAKAAANSLLAEGNDILLLCSGTGGKFSLEDVAAAGMVIAWLEEFAPGIILGDAAWAALALYQKFCGDLEGLLCMSDHGRKLAANGFSKDLKFCAQKDVFNYVPRYVDGVLTLEVKEG